MHTYLIYTWESLVLQYQFLITTPTRTHMFFCLTSYVSSLQVENLFLHLQHPVESRHKIHLVKEERTRKKWGVGENMKTNKGWRVMNPQVGQTSH